MKRINICAIWLYQSHHVGGQSALLKPEEPPKIVTCIRNTKKNILFHNCHHKNCRNTICILGSKTIIKPRDNGW
jgi:hypothetical protein